MELLCEMNILKSTLLENPLREGTEILAIIVASIKTSRKNR
jgi:hypothetical protein